MRSTTSTLTVYNMTRVRSDYKIACNRCETVTAAEEVCWYCDDFLCARCWDTFGHCGHEGADLIHEYGELTVKGLVPIRGLDELMFMSIDKLRAMVSLARARLNCC